MYIASWNVQSGGFAAYDAGLKTAARQDSIQRVVRHLHHDIGVTALVLCDTYRWAEFYGGNEGIARHLGYRTALYLDLNDQRLIDKHGPGISVVFATDLDVLGARIIWAHSRYVLEVVVQDEGKALRILAAYLDDLSEDVRLKQFSAIHNTVAAAGNIPTIIAGDLNALRGDLSQAHFKARWRDRLFRTLLPVLRLFRPKSELAVSAAGMNQRRLITTVEAAGYTDGGHFSAQPTIGAMGLPFPLICLDYIFANSFIRFRKFDVVPKRVHKNASDHAPVVAEINY